MLAHFGSHTVSPMFIISAPRVAFGEAFCTLGQDEDRQCSSCEQHVLGSPTIDTTELVDLPFSLLTKVMSVDFAKGPRQYLSKCC